MARAVANVVFSIFLTVIWGVGRLPVYRLYSFHADSSTDRLSIFKFGYLHANNS